MNIRIENPGVNKDISKNAKLAYDKAKDGDCLVLPSGKYNFLTKKPDYKQYLYPHYLRS